MEEHSSINDERVRWVLLNFKVEYKTITFAKYKAKNRQAYPLSSLLFIISVEILAIAIRENINVKGITINVQKRKLEC